MASSDRFTVGAEGAGSRLDQLLAALPSIGSRGKARKALSSGKVEVDGRPVASADGGKALPEGTEVVVHWTRPGTGEAKGRIRRHLDAAGVAVLFEDEVLLAFDKPPGMLTDAATRAQRRDEQTLTDRARAWTGRGDVWPVHRIDRDTSGVVLFAKGAEARAALKAQWEGDKPRRVYRAFVQGEIQKDPGWWEHWMRWDGKARRQVACKRGATGAVLGRCHVTVESRLRGATVIEVELNTGRRNQIRLSACLAGYPLVGERQYTPAQVGVHVPPRKLPRLERQALHAHQLEVRHPSTGKPLVLTSPVPADLTRWAKRLRSSGG